MTIRQGEERERLCELNYRIDILSISVQVVGPSQLGLRVHVVDRRGLRLPCRHLGHVIRSRKASNHVAPRKVSREIRLLLLSLPSPTAIKFDESQLAKLRPQVV